MIGKITGRIDYRGIDHVLIDVQGVGYLIYCSDRVLTKLPSQGSSVALYTELLVREDNLQLFGFLTLAEKEWHKLLTSVQGVGAKAALSIASTLGSDGISRAISLGDIPAIKAAQGIGPKIAQRIVTELKDKAPKIIAMGKMGASVAQVNEDMVIESGFRATETFKPSSVITSSVNAESQADALSALINLGYTQGDAANAVIQASEDTPDSNASDLIKLALKHLTPNT